MWGSVYLNGLQRGIEVIAAKSARQARNSDIAFGQINFLYRPGFELATRNVAAKIQ
jgi:hypothetical protein